MRARRMAPVTTKATPEEARAAIAGADGVAVPLWWRECEGAAIERRVVQVMEAFGLTRMMDLTDWLAHAGPFRPSHHTTREPGTHARHETTQHTRCVPAMREHRRDHKGTAHRNGERSIRPGKQDVRLRRDV